MKKTVGAIWFAFEICCYSLGLLLIIPFLFSYNQLKSLGDTLSKDGILESFTFARYQVIHWPAQTIGFLLLACATYGLVRRQVIQATLTTCVVWLSHMFTRLKRDTRLFWADLLPHLPRGWELAALLTISAAALAGRLFFIDQPIDYDEAYTFTEFAQHSFRQIVTDYHVPNNHVFQTILVRVSFLVFGPAPWALRIPVLLAGMALIPAIYLLAKSLYGRSTALIAASLTAATPILVFYSVTARGYMLVALFTVLTLILGLYLTHHKNLFAWLVWVVFIALGFYTLPIMLYPFGILITWLLMFGIAGDLSPQYHGMRGWLKYLLVASISAGALTVACYAPIFLKNGIFNFFNGATVVNSLSMSAFISSFPSKLRETLDNWRYRAPQVVETILIAGMFLSLIFHRSLARVRISLQAAVVIFLSIILLAQRLNSMPRIWLWLLPLCLIFSAAGFVGLFQRLFAQNIPQPIFKNALVGITILIVLSSSMWQGWQISPKPDKPYGGKEVELITRYLKDRVTPDDVIVPSSFSNAPLWYYARYLGIPNPIFRAIKSRPSYRAYVIVYPEYGDTVENVIQKNGPDLTFYDLKTKVLVFSSQNAQVYRVDAFPEVVNRAYGIK